MSNVIDTIFFKRKLTRTLRFSEIAIAGIGSLSTTRPKEAGLLTAEAGKGCSQSSQNSGEDLISLSWCPAPSPARPFTGPSQQNNCGQGDMEAAS